MQKNSDQYCFYGNSLGRYRSIETELWQKFLARKFKYNPQEKYILSAVENLFLEEIPEIRNIIRGSEGEKIDSRNSVIIGTVRKGFTHYRTAIAAASCASAMGYTPFWLDILSIPGITTDIVNFYTKWERRLSPILSRLERINSLFHAPFSSEINNSTIYAMLGISRASLETRNFKKSMRNSNISHLFTDLFRALPADIPLISTFNWNSIAAANAGRNHVVTIVTGNCPLPSKLAEGTMHAVHSPSAYFGFRILKGMGKRNQILKPVPENSLTLTGAFIDHEIVTNIEKDCRLRMDRIKKNEPKRFLISADDNTSHTHLFKTIIEHSIPLAQQNKAVLFINLGDRKNIWEKLQKDLLKYGEIIKTYSTWNETKSFADKIRNSELIGGIHIFQHDNIFHAVYATNYLMRVSDVLITQPNELSFYPVPKIITSHTRNYEVWNALRSGETGDSTLECFTSAETLQAIDVISECNDLLELFCRNILKNNKIGHYDGAYEAVSMASGKKFDKSKIGLKPGKKTMSKTTAKPKKSLNPQA